MSRVKKILKWIGIIFGAVLGALALFSYNGNTYAAVINPNWRGRSRSRAAS